MVLNCTPKSRVYSGTETPRDAATRPKNDGNVSRGFGVTNEVKLCPLTGIGGLESAKWLGSPKLAGDARGTQVDPGGRGRG